MEPQWKLASHWTPPPRLRLRLPCLCLNLTRWSLVLLWLAWLVPIFVLCWQMDKIARNSAFEVATGRSTEWLTRQVGQPQAVRRLNAEYHIWYFERGRFQVEVAVDQRGRVRAVRYLHRS